MDSGAQTDGGPALVSLCTRRRAMPETPHPLVSLDQASCRALGSPIGGTPKLTKAEPLSSCGKWRCTNGKIKK